MTSLHSLYDLKGKVRKILVFYLFSVSSLYRVAVLSLSVVFLPMSVSLPGDRRLVSVNGIEAVCVW